MTDSRTQIAYTGLLVVVTCWCGIQHGIPADLNRWASEDKKNSVWCPLGHKWVRRKDEADLRREAEAREVHLKDQLEAAQRNAEKIRVTLMKDRERWSKGMCPCCRRNFPALAQHVRTEHPDYDVNELKPPVYECSCGREFETMRGLRIHQGHVRPDNWWKPNQYTWRAHLTVTR